MSKSISNSQIFSETNRDAYSAGSYTNNRINSGESTSSYSSNVKSHNNDSLMNGTYDEREAQESFKQAVLEWRNSNNKTGKSVKINMTPKETRLISSRADANVGSDQKDLNYKTIENLVNKNHSLSYAERMLLRKHRRQELDFSLDSNNRDQDSRISSSNGDFIGENESEHMNFKDIMEAVNPKEKKTVDSYNSNSLKLDLTLNIEELETNNSIVKPKIFNERLLTPDIMDTKSNQSTNIQYANSRSNSIIKLNKENLDDEIPKSTRLLNSARAKSARKEKHTNNAQTNVLTKMESNLTRISSPRLKALTERKIDMFLNEDNLNGIGEFILMDVFERDTKQPKSSRPSSSQANTNNKLSFKCNIYNYKNISKLLFKNFLF
jgi:hypothetical protein